MFSLLNTHNFKRILKHNLLQFALLDQGLKHQNLILRPNYEPKTTNRPGLNRELALVQKVPKIPRKPVR